MAHQWDKDMYTMRNNFEGIHAPQFAQGQFDRPHWTDHRTHGLRRPGAKQLMLSSCGGPAERDWTPVWLLAGILVGYLFFRDRAGPLA